MTEIELFCQFQRRILLHDQFQNIKIWNWNCQKNWANLEFILVTSFWNQHPWTFQNQLQYPKNQNVCWPVVLVIPYISLNVENVAKKMNDEHNEKKTSMWFSRWSPLKCPLPPTSSRGRRYRSRCSKFALRSFFHWLMS